MLQVDKGNPQNIGLELRQIRFADFSFLHQNLSQRFSGLGRFFFRRPELTLGNESRMNDFNLSGSMRMGSSQNLLHFFRDVIQRVIGLHQIAGDAKLKDALDIVRRFQVGQDQNRQVFEISRLPDGFQNFKAGLSRQNDIQQHQARARVLQIFESGLPVQTYGNFKPAARQFFRKSVGERRVVFNY